MKINVKKEAARFIINETQGKVVCVLDHTAELFLIFADQNLPLSPLCDTLDVTTSKLYNKLLMPRRFVGIATCNPDDEFSVETGKLIAFSRAKDKLQTSFFKRANTYVNTINDLLDDALENINQYGKKLELNTKRRHAKIAQVLGEEEE